ncbi:MAG: hypothetical protein ACLPX7_13730 [Xanthobacteraceae bacterium]
MLVPEVQPRHSLTGMHARAIAQHERLSDRADIKAKYARRILGVFKYSLTAA